MEAVHAGIEGVLNVMAHLEMIERTLRQPAFGCWFDDQVGSSGSGGLLYSLVKAGDHVKRARILRSSPTL